MKTTRHAWPAALLLLISAITFSCDKPSANKDESTRIEELFREQLIKTCDSQPLGKKGACLYALFDFDNDSIPELLIASESNEIYFPITVYQVKHDSLQRIFSTHLGNGELYDCKDHIIKKNPDIGSGLITKIAMKNGRIRETYLSPFSNCYEEKTADTPSDNQLANQLKSEQLIELQLFLSKKDRDSELTLKENLQRFPKSRPNRPNKAAKLAERKSQQS